MQATPKPKGLAKIWREIKRPFRIIGREIKRPLRRLVNSLLEPEIDTLTNRLNQEIGVLANKCDHKLGSLNNRFDEKNLLLNTIKLKYVANASKVDILFISPPYWDVYSPFSAIPCLMGELKKYGIKAKNIDLGIMAFHEKFNKNWHETSKHFFSKEFFELRVRDYIYKDFHSFEEYLKKLDFLSDDTFTLKDFQRIYKQLDLIQQGVFDFIVQEIIRKNSVWIDLNHNINLNRIMEKCDINIISNAIEQFNLADDFLSLPDIVGVSVTSHQQFLPALAVMKILKIFKPNIKIISGGSYFEVIEKSKSDAMQQILKNLVDFIVVGEGETAVRMLVEHIKFGKHDISDIPNLFYLKGEKIHSTKKKLENIASLCAPDYSGLDFSLYLAQEPILSYQTSRGCHWGHCAFCNHNHSYRRNFRVKEIETVISDLKMLVGEYNIHNFQFVDEAIEVNYFIDFIEALSKEEFSKKIKWFYYSRVSHLYNNEIVQKAKECGCKMVMFGVETFCQRLLNFIKKGTVIKNIFNNLELFHKNGIKTFAWLMHSLPTQTEEELLCDIKTLEENFENIDVCCISHFHLSVNCDMYRNPKQFNIVKWNEHNEFDFESEHNGRVIPKSKLIELIQSKYIPLVHRHVFTNQRYMFFFKTQRGE
jgi:hypothetical protein